MGLDLIDIALERLTDFTEFERLATSIMYLEGWISIKPLGGTADLGQDALSEKFYRDSENIERTVFQYTLQEYLPGKVNDTIEKLNKNGIAFSELVVVTPHSLSSDAQIKMRQGARKTYGVSLLLYERGTLRTRLGDLNNGLFHRHFPDIKAQLADLERAGSTSSFPDSALERSLLQVSLALTFRPGSERVRKSVFDYFILAILLAESSRTLSIADAAEKAAAALNSKRAIPQEQVAAAAGRLKKMGFVEVVGGILTSEEKALAVVATGNVKLNEGAASFAADIVSAVRSALGKAISVDLERRISRNTRNVLIAVARSRGAHFDGQPSPTEDLLIMSAAKEQLPNELSAVVMAAFADVFRAPSQEQAATMAHWTQAYLTLAIIGADPTLSAFQAGKFRKKTFILDTDVVLDSVVGDGNRSAGLRRLLESLIDSGSRIVIPDSVVAECVLHAERSPKTYNYFGAALLQLSPAVVEQQVWNVFVKGYYYAQTSKGKPLLSSYSDYLSNFYEPRRPDEFMQSTLKEVLPDGIEIIPLGHLKTEELTDMEIDNCAQALRSELASSKKSQFRTEEEEAKLASTDATLFLTAVRMNSPNEDTRHDVLGGTCYLITETPRYARVGKALGIKAAVTIRPAALASIQELIGAAELSPEEFVQLFDNPFLDGAVKGVWPDLEKLLRSGVNLRDKSLSRLRFDLDDALHEQIARLARIEIDDDEVGVSSQDADKEYWALLETATKRGYSLIPDLTALREKIQAGDAESQRLQQQLDEAATTNQALQEQIEFFGKRKQRYLRRVASKGRAAPKQS